MTPKQEAFAQAIVSGASQSEAYRTAFNVGVGTKPETVHKRASELMANGEVTGRVAELRKPVAQKAQITLESHLDDLMRLRNMAAKEKQYSAAISAEIARGKASGVHVERSELNLGGMQGVLVAGPVLTPDEWAKAAAIQQADLQKGA